MQWPATTHIIIKMIRGWVGGGNPLVDLFRSYCWNCTSLQHIRSYPDRYQLVMVHTHGDFIVLPHWETRPLATWFNIPIKHIYPDRDNQSFPILLMSSTGQGSDKYKFYKSLVWLKRELNSQSPTCVACTLPIWPARLVYFPHAVWNIACGSYV